MEPVREQLDARYKELIQQTQKAKYTKRGNFNSIKLRTDPKFVEKQLYTFENPRNRITMMMKAFGSQVQVYHALLNAHKDCKIEPTGNSQDHFHYKMTLQDVAMIVRGINDPNSKDSMFLEVTPFDQDLFAFRPHFDSIKKLVE